MTGTAVRVVLACVVALAPASAGAAPRPVALTAVPARVSLAGSGRTTVRVTNSGTKRVLVDVSRAGFALDLRGRPRIERNAGARSAARWLTVRPRRFALAPHATASLSLATKLPRRAEPGDHDALVLLSTRPLASGRVAVRLRMGLVVVVRAPGRVVHGIELGSLRLARRSGGRALELVVANRGNVTEPLEHVRAVVASTRTGRRVELLRAGNRDLRPRTRGILDFRLRAQHHGSMNVRITIPASNGRRVLTRAFRIRL